MSAVRKAQKSGCAEEGGKEDADRYADIEEERCDGEETISRD